MAASSWRRTGLYALERQSFWFICYGQEEDNGRNSRILATEKFESHEASNGSWSKVYRCSHFFKILRLAISSRWTWNLFWSWNLPVTNTKINELVGIYNNLIEQQIFPRPESFMIGSLVQRQQNTRNDAGEKNWRKIG